MLRPLISKWRPSILCFSALESLEGKFSWNAVAQGVVVGAMIGLTGGAVLAYGITGSALASTGAVVEGLGFSAATVGSAGVTGFEQARQLLQAQQMRIGEGAGSKLFKSQELLESHYVKHGTEIQKALGEISYSITQYLDDANFILKNGIYVPELNGYVRFMGGQKYGFVGLDRATGDITTFHVKTVSELIKNALSLGFGK